MASNKGLKSVIICVLVLGLVLEQVQVEGKSCCKNNDSRVCYKLCVVIPGTSPRKCAAGCDCKIISGNKCSPDYPELHGHSDIDTPSAVEFCNMGCMSSICDNNTNKASHGEEKEIDAELCGSVCASFCNQIAVGASVAA
uniref:Uncharacterized protein n=1 Tax=Avena sativa TaxID=4498 RepID=A0ACD5ZDF2_AVESA